MMSISSRKGPKDLEHLHFAVYLSPLILVSLAQIPKAYTTLQRLLVVISF
jgi:hypothetical protein